MNTTWRSVLCQHGWVYPTTSGNWMKLNMDGTGEGRPLSSAQSLHGRPLGDSATDTLQLTGKPENAQDACQHVSVDIEITLCERKPAQGHETTRPDVNVTNLTSAAFQPKQYRLQITKGAFPADKWLCFQDSPDSRRGDSDSAAAEMDAPDDFQLVFDRSPYPPVGEWAEQNNIVGRAIRLHKFWDFRDFYKNA